MTPFKDTILKLNLRYAKLIILLGFHRKINQLEVVYTNIIQIDFEDLIM